MIKPFTEKAKETLKESFNFIPTNITESKKLAGNLDLKINEETYSEIYFQPMNNERINKGSVVLISSNSNTKIKATVVFEIEEI